jgi:hypothetical protein
MTLGFTLFNCFLLIVPLLVWNLVLGPRIRDRRITSDAFSPRWLLAAENITRILVFAFPLLIPLHLKDSGDRAGMAVYLTGTLVYFASWLPLILSPAGSWSSLPTGLLAPRLTPLLSFLGIAMMGESWLYGLIAAAFIFFHTMHGIQNLDIDRSFSAPRPTS